MTDTTVISPVKLAHIVIRTPRYAESIAWWSTVLGAEVRHQNDFLCFLTYDDEHHPPCHCVDAGTWLRTIGRRPDLSMLRSRMLISTRSSRRTSAWPSRASCRSHRFITA